MSHYWFSVGQRFNFYFLVHSSVQKLIKITGDLPVIEKNIFAFYKQPINKQKNAPCLKAWIVYHHTFLKHFITKVYLKNTGWSLYDVVSCEKWPSSPLTTSMESMPPFSFACLCDANEMTGLGSLRLLTCLGKLHVTSAPGDFLTKNRNYTQ